MPYSSENNAFFYAMNPLPLHQCGVPQKSYTAKLTDALIKNFAEMVKLTKEKVPGRMDDFKLDRSNSLFEPNKKISVERVLENNLHKAFHDQGSFNLSSDHAQAERVSHIVTYQMPLAAHGTQEGENRKWGKVDLIGCTQDNRPAILELKKAKSSESPLRMIVEGLAYAIAVQKMWNEQDNEFRKEWYSETKAAPNAIPTRLKEIRVIGLAPELYWKRWMQGASGFSKLDDTSKTKIWELIQHAQDDGYLIDFVVFEEGDAKNPPSHFEVITKEFCNQT